MSKNSVIGIDLGTTYSCVGVFMQGQVKIIPVHQYNTMPSYVAFTDTVRQIGLSAKVNGEGNPKNTIYDTKRLIGRKYEDTAVQENLKKKRWTYDVVDEDGKPMIRATYRFEENLYAPEQISAMLLSELKGAAADYLKLKKNEIKKAVLTIPANFTNAQREATFDAAKIAELEVKLIHEPTAAAIAYGLDKNVDCSKYILVFDFGGGTLDVSVLCIKGSNNSVFTVLATAGNPCLGGIDIDTILVEFCVENFKRAHKNVDPTCNPKAMYKLQLACEDAKKNLSSVAETQIILENFHAGFDLKQDIGRARFDELCKPVFNQILEPIERALKDASVNRGSIDDVVMVGGSSNNKKVQSIIKEHFDWKDPIIDINPEEAIAFGAAVHGGSLAKEKEVTDVLLLDVTPLTLGVETRGGMMGKVIHRNTPIPCEESTLVSTSADNQPTVKIQVFEGERLMTADNTLLGTFELSGIAPAARRVPKIKVTFKLNEDGYLLVSAVDIGSGNSHSLQIQKNKGSYSDEDIKRMINVSRQHAKDDEEKLKKILMRRKVEDYARSVKQAADAAPNGKLSEDDNTKIENYCKRVDTWLERNVTAEMYEIKGFFREVREVLSPLVVVLKGSEYNELVNENSDSDDSDSDDSESGDPRNRKLHSVD